jgi:hypothetical protein
MKTDPFAELRLACGACHRRPRRMLQIGRPLPPARAETFRQGTEGTELLQARLIPHESVERGVRARPNGSPD